MTRRTAYWTCQIGGWGTYFVLTTVQLRKEGGPWSMELEILIAAALGMTLTHALRGVIRRRGWLQVSQRALGLRLAVAAVVLAIVEVAALAAVEAAMTGTFTFSAFAYAVARWTMAFLVWEGAYVSLSLVDARQRDALAHVRLEAAVRAADLRALEARLNPHFLFNALNSVRALIGDEPERARDAVTRLARMLRYGLAVERDAIVSLDRELEIMNDYLGIEQLRFDERLRIEVDVSSAAGARMPPLILQTLVENAIKHGIARMSVAGTVRIAARLVDDALVIEIENPRPAREAPSDSTGLGLSSARERLRLLYGERASLELDLSAPDRATTRLVVPQRMAP